MSALQKIINCINANKPLPKELELSQFDRVMEFETDDISIESLQDLIDLLNTKTHLLQNTTAISLRLNELSEIPDFVFEAKKLRRLELKRNNLKTIPDKIKQLHRLEYLDISDNYLERICDGILELRELRDLVIHRNRIQSIPKSINRLLHLRSFIAYNNRIKIIPKEILELEKLTDVKLNDNRIVNVPDGIFTQRNAMNALRMYFDSIENSENTSILYEGKIILLGNGHAGKTTLLKNLVEPCGLDSHDSTLGLDIEEWELFSIEKQKNVKFRIWDFGGQGKYRSIQQLFATPNAIYLYVGVPEDLKTFEKYGDYRYWLNFVDIVGDKKSPVIFITNKIDLLKTDEAYIDKKTIKEEFPLVTQFIDTCFHRNGSSTTSIQKIKQAIEASIHFQEDDETTSLDNKIVLHKLPNEWIHLINTINGLKKSRDYITFEDFKELCNDSKIYDSDKIEYLLEYLDKSGIILKYSGQRSFRFHIILNPTWIKDIVFEILKHLEQEKRSWFTEEDLKIIWSDYYDQKVYYDEITDLMKELNFSFRIKEKNYIPSLLPTYSDTEQHTTFDKQYSVQFTFEPFIPAGLLYRMFFKDISMFEVNNEALFNNRILLEYYGTPIEIIEYWEEGKLLMNVGESSFSSINVIDYKLGEAIKSLEGRNYLSEILIIKEILVYNKELEKNESYDFDYIKKYATVDQLLNKNKDMRNINIYGDGDYLEQGNKIVHNYNNSDLKEELEELIKKYAENEEQSEELLEATEILGADLPDTTKKKHGKKIRNFLTNVATKSGEVILKRLIESGFEAWL
jgi:GTPase SAR1 family protein